MNELLEFDRIAILHGEVWRLITGHFVHWSAAHLAWDVLAFFALGAIVMGLVMGRQPEGLSYTRCRTTSQVVRRLALLVAVVIATALIVSLFLLIFCPEVGKYRGLSAIDSALWMWAVFIIGERRVGLALTLLSLFFAKLMIESAGAALFAGGGITVMPVVHLVGAIAGFCGSIVEHKMRALTDATDGAAFHRDRRPDRVRRRGDESPVVGGAA